jgi:hypothetical protein
MSASYASHARLIRVVALLALPAFACVGDVGTQSALPGADFEPAVSPDGRWLIFQRQYAGSRYTPPNVSLWIAHASGSNERIGSPATASASTVIGSRLGIFRRRRYP